MSIPVTRFEYVEIPIPSGSTLRQFPFPDLPNLRNAKILSMELFYNIDPNTNATYAPSGSQTMGLSIMVNCYLTMYEGDLQIVKDMPVVKLQHFTYNNVDDSIFSISTEKQVAFNGPIISWNKSFVRFSRALSETDVVVAFGITYLQPEDAGYNLIGR